MARKPLKSLAGPVATAGHPTPGGGPTDSPGAPGQPLTAPARAQQSLTSVPSGSGGSQVSSGAAAAAALTRRA